MSVKDLKKKLNNILTKDESVVVSINGKWGVGKTYFWHQFKEQLTDKKVAYVSLFGKETISSIRTDIFLQVISKKKKAWHTTAKHIKDITIPYIGIGITLLDKQDFKDIIVCFDDFERLSSSMELKEVLGLISELKEQKNCSVVMILNEDELRDNKETLDKYKEKLIDYEFSYDPRPFESLEILQDKLTAFKEYPLQKYLTRHKINNIRVISRIINALNDFSFIESDIKDVPEVTTEIVGNIIEIAAINAQTSSFLELTEYANKRIRSDASDKLKKNKKYEDLLSLISKAYGYSYEAWGYSYEAYFLKSDIVTKLFEYCQTSLTDEESFKKIVRSKINNQSLYSRYKGILEKHQYDMQYKKKVFVSDLWNFLKEQNIIIDKDASHLNPETFISYIKKLKALNAKDKAEYHDFALKCLKGYIENNPSWRKDIINLQALLDFDPELDEYDKQCTVKNQQNTINSSEKIRGLMRDVIENGKSDEALSQIQKQEIKQYILNDARYFKETFDFLMDSRYTTESLKKYVGNIGSVLKELSLSKNSDHAYKAKKVLDSLAKRGGDMEKLLNSNDISK
ncbi:hypothetical protein BSPWISOXPB_1427 [uncultured Gammaproteobacteria bacterium]|nr:hypothetical protein BSPWISOXPB_1427 [uncultured Gammaproteobacteria bacterium]